MSIITFWNDDKEQTGKTLSAVAVATKMAIERNLKILLLSTSYNEKTMSNCYFEDKVVNDKVKKLMGKSNNIAVENGISGLYKLIASNKIEPTVITDYTKVILKDRLEVLAGYMPAPIQTDEENLETYEKIMVSYPNLITTANLYYDIVIVDIDNGLAPDIKKQILDLASLNLMVISPRLEGIHKYFKLIEKRPELTDLRNMTVIAKIHEETKYNKKNVMRLIKSKDVYPIPFNRLFYEAAEEYAVTELFLKLRKILDTQDENYIFLNDIQKIADKILIRLKELQKKMR